MSDVIVNAGCMLFFTPDVSGKLEKDVLDSTLFAQLTASKKYSRFGATKQWQERQLAAMTQFGWVMNTVERFNQPAPCKGDATIWAWLNEVLPRFMPAEAMAQGQASVCARYEAGPAQRGFELFAQQVSAPAQSLITETASLPAKPDLHTLTPVVMQFGFVDATAALYLVTLSFTRRDPLTPGFLFEPMSDTDVRGNIETSFHALRLQDVVYAQYRDTLDAKLCDPRGSLVASLVEVNSGH
jgi:hypothetical protein